MPTTFDARVTIVLPKLTAAVPPVVRAYLTALAAWQTADGLATVSRATLATELGVTERTVQRWHASAEALGLVARVAGGYRGRVQTVRLLCVAPFSPRERRARNAHAAARRRRQAGIVAKQRASMARHTGRIPAWTPARKGDTAGPPHTSKSEARLASPPLTTFEPAPARRTEEQSDRPPVDPAAWYHERKRIERQERERRAAVLAGEEAERARQLRALERLMADGQ